MATYTFLGYIFNFESISFSFFDNFVKPIVKNYLRAKRVKKKKKEYYGTKLKSLSSKFVFVELRRYPCRETIS